MMSAGTGAGGSLGGSAAAAMLKSPQTALQLLLEEINFQRTKEMRQLLKDEGGFVVLQGTTYWTDLFVRHFLFQSEPEHSIDCDDLLFFVRKKHIKGSSRAMPKYETEIEVFRKDSRKLPIGDPDVDWEETVYLNLVIHQFNYTLTLAICTRTSPKELQVLRRHSQKVYASPSRRKMDTKGDSEEITYPHICFMVDNFDEVFHDILVRDGEMVCVELVATDRDGSVQGVIFLGSIRYDALKRVYDARQSSLGSKVAQRMSFGLFSSGGPQTRCEFVRMKGPQGKGHAEMAVTKPKGSGVETPTSEPGFCATDMWDSEWEEDCEEYYNYRHQRRLSDPSANLNNFSRYGWRTKNATDGSSGYGGSKARSENEGLDCLANEVSEIEAGDLRDVVPQGTESLPKPQPHGDIVASLSKQSKGAELKGSTNKTRPAESIGSGTATSTSNCCSCFGTRKRWSDTDSMQMSEVYEPCPKCGSESAEQEVRREDGKRMMASVSSETERRLQSLELHDSPACLATVSKGRSPLMKHRNVLIVESELEFAGGAKVRTSSPSTSAPIDERTKKKVLPQNVTGVKKRDNSQKVTQSPKKRLSTPVFRSKRFNGNGPEVEAGSGKPAGKGKVTTSNSNAINNNNNGRRGRSGGSTSSLGPPAGATEATEDGEYELADDAVSLNGGGDLTEAGEEVTAKPEAVGPLDPKQLIRVNGKEEFPAERTGTRSSSNASNTDRQGKHQQPKAMSVSVANIKEHRERRTSNGRVTTTDQHRGAASNGTSSRFSLIYRRSKSSSAATQAFAKEDKRKSDGGPKKSSDSVIVSSKDENPKTSLKEDDKKREKSTVPESLADPFIEDTKVEHKGTLPPTVPPTSERDINGNPDETTTTTTATATTTTTTDETSESELSNRAIWAALKDLRAKKECSTLPKMKKPTYNSFYARPTILGGREGADHRIDTIPTRRTPDGTNIYYLCDYHPKRHHGGGHGDKELDDGAYNPLWTTKGFTQTFHFWKENRRQQSTPLNAFLTYVTLPWWSIAKDLLDHREQPILTF
ncbi:serine-rich adhesin for platelets isoform X2 [Anopheles coustani]|uniref:serine-rich adhesin for platelets isoform X2 n=1 Tax=Anopheles coustani TaxID=139045 RepID=UPI0026585881|nr:serine-rich adhesin for platelets isoform X2 [Anopheles coustani]